MYLYYLDMLILLIRMYLIYKHHIMICKLFTSLTFTSFFKFVGQGNIDSPDYDSAVYRSI